MSREQSQKPDNYFAKVGIQIVVFTTKIINKEENKIKLQPPVK